MTSRTQAPRLAFVEGLRGLAFGVVLLFHAVAWAKPGGAPEVVAYAGHSGVDLFFVISGFCMVWPLLDGHGQLRPLDARRFFVRRAWRIGPPFLVVLVLAIGVSYLMWAYGGPSLWGELPMQGLFPTSAPNLIGNVVSHLTFTHGFFPMWDRSIDGAYWSLSVEWQFYATLPLLVLVARRFGMARAVAVTFAVSAAYAIGVHVLNPNFIVTAVGSDIIPGRLCEFGAGMLAARLVVAGVRIPGLAPAAVALTAAAIGFDYTGPLVLHPLAYAVAYGALLLGCGTTGSLARVAATEPLRRLGRVSYSGYLVHGTVLMAVSLVLTRFDPSIAARSAVLIVVGPVLSLLCAGLLYRYVELLAVGRSHAVRRRTPAVSKQRDRVGSEITATTPR